MDAPSLANATAYLPSPADLLLAVPRLLSKAGLYPEHLDSVFDRFWSGGSVIASATTNLTNATASRTGAGFVQHSAAAVADAAAPEEMSALQALRNIGTIFAYFTSKWCIATFTIAIFLNRTHFYASSRVPLTFNRFHIRFVLYILPTLLFISRTHGMLQAIRCQTSPTWSQLQYGLADGQLDSDFAGEGGYLWKGSSALLFWESLESSCRAVNMLPLDPSLPRPSGSLAMLWPLFLSLGFSQFVETLACALQGRQPLHEVGMTIFEHSLAFAEAEALVTRSFGMSSAQLTQKKTVPTPDGTKLSLSRYTISRFANVPQELLLISLISSFSHLTSNILAMFGLRTKFRLVTTSIWGIAYMSTFAWSFLRLLALPPDRSHPVGIIGYPTVCTVGFIPHLLILLGTIACGLIYLLAFALTILSPPPGQPESLTWRERCSAAYSNLHANIHLSTITPLTIGWHEDFYTAILKVGFTVMTAASEAVYLNEGKRVNVDSMTWLEKKRLDEFVARRRRLRQHIIAVPRELHGDTMAAGLEIDENVDDSASMPAPASGYARERKTRGNNVQSDAARAVGRDNGVGVRQRTGRWSLTYQFFKSISRLLLLIQAKMIILVLTKVRIGYRPRWLRQLAGPESPEKSSAPSRRERRSRFATPAFDDDNNSQSGIVSNFVLDEFSRDRLERAGFLGETNDFPSGSWKNLGRFSSTDNSDDYLPPSDDDLTSTISESTTTTNDEWSDTSDGQRTPTQWSFPRSRDVTPILDDTLDLSRLSHLLDPRSSEDREEARLLARRLNNPGTMTRARFRQQVERDEGRILTSSRLPITFPQHSSPEEEEQILEEYILARRVGNSHPSSSNSNGTSLNNNRGGSWDTGADGLGSEGPQCVVCQISPRTVLVWPCGCLSLCDECRVGLASKNYNTCVCCRTGVVAFSRLYVP